MVSSSSRRYPNQSVFDVAVNAKGQVGTQHLTPEPIHVAVVEFDDNGIYVDKRQIERAETCILDARRENLNGAVVVVFVHGWHHDASWRIDTNEGDDHFKRFRKILNGLAVRELERWTPGGDSSFPAVDSRTVVGIYIGWDGDPNWCCSRRRGLTHLSFFNRYDAASKISKGPDIRETIRRIHESSKKPLERKPGDARPIRADCPLILIGHSMGALILESAFLALTKDEEHPFLRYQQESVDNGYVEIRHDNDRVSFPDLLLALNSAADSAIAREIRQALEDLKLTKTISADDIGYSPPLFISLTSTADIDTKWTWRLAQLLDFRKLSLRRDGKLMSPLAVLRDRWRKTDGHDHSLATHTFRRLQRKVPCEAKNKIIDFGQFWHCLRLPCPLSSATPTFYIDLPSGKAGEEADRRDHDRYELKPKDEGDREHLMWLFQVPPEVIEDHNDIFNSTSSLLIMALLQISGSVMSLAQGWKENFEE